LEGRTFQGVKSRRRAGCKTGPGLRNTPEGGGKNQGKGKTGGSSTKHRKKKKKSGGGLAETVPRG